MFVCACVRVVIRRKTEMHKIPHSKYVLCLCRFAAVADIGISRWMLNFIVHLVNIVKLRDIIKLQLLVSRNTVQGGTSIVAENPMAHGQCCSQPTSNILRNKEKNFENIHWHFYHN
ncbi:hypothetical protein Tsp_11770 [Trichinella spiralis]|uniref:hypothetical protein n=1 Tax=Trichinella spiralis TaxID=6334 RepID=UPI0001EFEA87|nr:hypothetical protein Tsp_11770 [Trichinella spiralis]